MEYPRYTYEGGYKRATKPYSVWIGMKARIKRNSTICNEWLDYQTFARWYSEQVGAQLDYHLDKDLLSTGNRHYSPSTCLLIPHFVNTHLNNKLNKVNKTTDLVATLGPYPLDKRVIPALVAWSLH